MGILDFFKKALGSPESDGPSNASPNEAQALSCTFMEEGVSLQFATPLARADVESLQLGLESVNAHDSVLGAYLIQLVIEGQAVLSRSAVTIEWSRLFELQSNPDHAGALEWLRLPPPSALHPLLTCESTLSNSSFRIEIAGWADERQEVKVKSQVGAVLEVNDQPQLLSQPAWQLIQEIKAFEAQTSDRSTQHDREIAWGRIRRWADAAGALYLSEYLRTTYVLTPETLRLPLTRQESPFGRVYTVAPTFDGAPTNWLSAFDEYSTVQPHYELTRGGGRVRIVITEPVRKVLSVIKREMPGRKVAGARAEKFIHNPWAFLGDVAHEVINEAEFEKDRLTVGPAAAIFSLVARYTEGRVEFVDLVVTVHFNDGAAKTSSESFKSPEDFQKFLGALRAALEDEREWLAWREFDLTLDADATTQLEIGMQLVHLWINQPAEMVSVEDIYTLGDYSTRIEGIGVARAIYVPVLTGKRAEGEDDGWPPADLTPTVMVTLQGHEGQVLIPLTRDWVNDFEKRVSQAIQSGEPTVSDPALPTQVDTGQAKKLLEGFQSMLAAADKVKADKPKSPQVKRAPRETLLVKTNFHAVDYFEGRRSSLAVPPGATAKLPTCLRHGVGLKQHQLAGVAWFQHLVSKAPHECRGALLADDMGLGKTLQLLSVLARHYEENPTACPSLIVAPKSLLENWHNETEKFFTPAFPRVLVLYGEELKAQKQPLALIDSELQRRGVVELLRPGWTGGAKVILTTYEVLTSYEFSFAKQPFAFVICDEAQRIKNPGAMVTMAVKKLKADFRVACTGTPVENTLADLWCLFDFVQPGLLGALEEFGKSYRRPIECDTEEQQQALERLQDLIAPQTLRRTKADIAADLPQKYFAHRTRNDDGIKFKPRLEDYERLEVELTQYQLILYKAGLKKLQEASQERDGRKRAQLSFGALHLMKAVCAEPYCLPGTKFLVDSAGLDVHLSHSPKMKWLLDRLIEVKAAGEKAIVFTELREAQAALYYFMNKTFGVKPFVINGDSQGRQAYIDKFSASQGFDVIILSTLAAGAGLNVTAANHVFHFTRAWNPAKESQATDRAYRIGATKDVYVYCPTVVADFKTFEVRLDELLKRKAKLAGSTLDDRGLKAMLNGSGPDATFSELVGDGVPGQELPKRYLTMDDVDRLDGFGFEVFCCLLWSKRGYQASLTPKRGGDGGVDVIALGSAEGELLQCKSSINAEVGWDAVKEVATGAARYQARFLGTPLRKLAVTNQVFTSGATEHAAANRVELVTRRRLEELVAAHPITNLELDDALVHWRLFEQRAA